MIVSYDQQSNAKSSLYLKFDFGGVFQEGTVINSAFVDLYQSGSSGANAIPLTLHQITSDWSSDITWNTKPQIGEPYATVNTDNGKQTRSWDITPLMRNWYSRASRNYGIYITADGPQAVSFSRSFDSLDTNSVFQPVLRVDYTPPQQQNQPAAGGFALPSLKPIGNAPIVGGGIDLNILLISGVVAENVSQTGATVKWQTSHNATSWVFYGDAGDGSDRFDKQTGRDDSSANHTINLANLEPGKKYSYKVFSKDANNKQSYGPIKYFSTLTDGEGGGAMGNAGIVAESEDQAASDPISKVQEKIENKVAEYTIEKSLTEDNPANNLPASGSAELSESNLIPSGAVSKVAGFVGLSKLAGFLLIILGLMCLVGCLILYKLTKKAHHHIRKHFDSDYAKKVSKKKK